MKNNIGTEFMKKTRYPYLDESDQAQGVLQPPLELPYDETKPLIDLPDIKDISLRKVDYIDLLARRRTVREYSGQPMRLKELSFLLWSTQGIKETVVRETPKGTLKHTLRTVPSAGARHPLETFLVINNVEGLDAGLYRYLSSKHKLLAIDTSENIRDEIVTSCWNQQFIKVCNATFIWVADSYRTTWRYGERGIRYIHLDAGHVCQNLYLTSTAIGAGACGIASFDDEALGHLLGIDTEKVFVVYMATSGKMKEETKA
jgi:SagB-type dehydrogenase family enzyme